MELETVHVPSELKIRRLKSDSMPDLSSKNMSQRQVKPTNVGDIRDSRMKDQGRFLMFVSSSVCEGEHAVAPSVLLVAVFVLLTEEISYYASLRLAQPDFLASLEEGFELVQIEVVTLERGESRLREPQVTAHIEVILHAVTLEDVVVAHRVDGRDEVQLVLGHEQVGMRAAVPQVSEGVEGLPHVRGSLESSGVGRGGRP